MCAHTHIHTWQDSSSRSSVFSQDFSIDGLLKWNTKLPAFASDSALTKNIITKTTHYTQTFAVVFKKVGGSESSSPATLIHSYKLRFYSSINDLITLVVVYKA